MTRKTIYDKVDLLKEKINELLIVRPYDFKNQIYSICSNAENYVLTLHSPELKNMIRICDIEKKERKYMSSGVYELIDTESTIEPMKQLEIITDMVGIYLYRIEEHFSDEDIEEAVMFLINKKISADFISVMVEDFIEEKETVLFELAKKMQEKGQISTALQIYSILYKKLKKEEYRSGGKSNG